MVDRNNLKEILGGEDCTLGEGAFGKVTKKQYRGIEVAEKSFKTGSIACVNREAAIINSFDHPGLFFLGKSYIDVKPYGCESNCQCCDHF